MLLLTKSSHMSRNTDPVLRVLAEGKAQHELSVQGPPSWTELVKERIHLNMDVSNGAYKKEHSSIFLPILQSQCSGTS